MSVTADYLSASIEYEQALARKNIARKGMDYARAEAETAIAKAAAAGVIKKALAAAAATADAFDVAVVAQQQAQQRRLLAQGALKEEAPF